MSDKIVVIDAEFEEVGEEKVYDKPSHKAETPKAEAPKAKPKVKPPSLDLDSFEKEMRGGIHKEAFDELDADMSEAREEGTTGGEMLGEARALGKFVWNVFTK